MPTTAFWNSYFGKLVAGLIVTALISVTGSGVMVWRNQAVIETTQVSIGITIAKIETRQIKMEETLDGLRFELANQNWADSSLIVNGAEMKQTIEGHISDRSIHVGQ